MWSCFEEMELFCIPAAGRLHETTHALTLTNTDAKYQSLSLDAMNTENEKKAVPFISGQTLISASVNSSAAALFCSVELLLKCH